MLRRIVPTLLLLCLAISASLLRAQTTTTGELAGTVTDPSGAVVTNSTVTITNVATGAKVTAQTNSTGAYRFPLLPPGTYRASASASGFRMVDKTIDIGLGASVSLNLQLGLGSSTETVEVTGAVPTVETEDANLNTNFTAKQIEMLPNSGNDLSAVAFTTPGAVVNTTGGSTFGGGNFEMYGLPATSNLFTVDGANYNDPYFNVNNSGATNLTIGLNDVQESAVVANGYSGSYGGLAGANINYATKSGSNRLHGNAEYWWNGDSLNANNYFLNQSGSARPFVNANQFAGSIGGPIKKDKAFFFFDYEGLYLAIPVINPANVPTAAFEQAVIGNLNSTGLSASVPFYNKMFGLYNGLSQANAVPVPGSTNGGCSDVSTLNGITFGATNPCAVQVQASPVVKTHDVFYAGRYDENIGNRDKLFLRVEHEHGLQASFTDPVNSAFNAISDQPQWTSNFQETHTFGTDKVNSFNASLLWYSALFTMQNQAAASSALPTLPGQTMTLALNDGSLAALNGLNVIFPQGRRITQYQFVDDFSWVHGRHTFKVGANYRRDDVSDHTFQFITPEVVEFTLGDFANGGGSTSGNLIVQSFPKKTEQPIAMYQVGFYGADDVRVTNNLKLTLSLRLDHLSNPVCQANCFQRFTGTFGQMNTALPVNQAIQTGLHTAFPSVTGIVAQPKIGFAWSPRGGNRPTVIRGGAGIFADSLPTGTISTIMAQAPNDPQFNTLVGYLSPNQTGPLSNAAFGVNCAADCQIYQQSAASNATFVSNFTNGGTVAPFSFFNTTKVKVPRYYEWSLEVQQGIGWATTLNAMYVGNHGSNEEITNTALNAFFTPTSTIPRFANLPTTVPDGRFGVVSEQQNIANSNYTGLVLGLKHDFKGGLAFQASYTYSHALDEISNNSVSPFGLNTTAKYADIINGQDSSNLRAYNHGNADYDIRHNFTMNYVWSDGIRHLTAKGPNALVKGWTFSGTIFRHSGLPFTVVDSAATNLLEATNYGPAGGTQQVFANVVGSTTNSCGASAATLTGAPCLQQGDFTSPTRTGNWGQQRRNQFRGPGYFNTDFAVEKGFGIPKWETAQFSIGARFFNVFNHPNFAFPIMVSGATGFGRIIQTVSSPTSIYGSGLGADASPRLIQLQAKFTF